MTDSKATDEPTASPTIGAADDGPRRRTAPGRLTVFGHDPTPAEAELVHRSRRWRALQAAKFGVGGLVLAPLVALVPPHAPWALGAVAGGGFLARRRWQERTTLLRLEGRCPRCAEPIVIEPGSRLRSPHPVPCESCHHEATLEVELDG